MHTQQLVHVEACLRTFEHVCQHAVFKAPPHLADPGDAGPSRRDAVSSLGCLQAGSLLQLTGGVGWGGGGGCS